MSTDRIARQLRAARIDAGRTQQSVADEAGVLQSMVSDWETGRTAITLPSLRSWARALGHTVVLLPMSGPGSTSPEPGPETLTVHLDNRAGTFTPSEPRTPVTFSPEAYERAASPEPGPPAERCPCFYPDATDADTCACGDALDEHDETGQCQARRAAGHSTEDGAA